MFRLSLDKFVVVMDVGVVDKKNGNVIECETWYGWTARKNNIIIIIINKK